MGFNAPQRGVCEQQGGRHACGTVVATVNADAVQSTDATPRIRSAK